MGSGARGPSQRQLRVGEVIRQRLAEVLARDDLEAKILKKTPKTKPHGHCEVRSTSLVLPGF